MGVEPDRVVAVWIFARIEQQPDDLKMAKLRCQRERTMPILMAGTRKQSKGVFGTSQRSRDW